MSRSVICEAISSGEKYIGPAFEGPITIGDFIVFELDETECDIVLLVMAGGVPDQSEASGGTADRPRDEYLKDII